MSLEDASRAIKERRMKLLSMADLRLLKGVSYSRAHLFRLIRAGRFPKPIKLGENRNAFVEAEIDQWIEARIAARDNAWDQSARDVVL
jgi:prophage regulatory protein